MISLTIFRAILTAGLISAQVLADATAPTFYTAGVVEFRPNMFGMSSADMLADHLRAYDEIVRRDEANSTDIIVFPEGTLNNMFHLTFVPAPKDNVIPCLQNGFADFLVKLSCTARDVRKYLVINLSEKENCSTVANDPRPCASNGLNIYNTNVVFDREGRVISRYRKIHIYVEEKNTTHEPEFGIFDTDFGVRFGHFICFDILFYTPAQELVTRYGIKDFVFTSLFYSELPFLTGVQLQQSWAWGNDVNLLAAGASYPQEGTTGTGIYAGNTGYLVSTMTGGTGVRKLFVARVPKHKVKTENGTPKGHQTIQRAQTGIKLMKDPQINVYTSELLDFHSHSNISRSLCYGSFCCDFQLRTTLIENLTNSEHYKYRIGVFDGTRTYEKEEWSDIKVCALYTCTTNDVKSCGEIFEANVSVEPNVEFESIEIKGKFEKVDKMLIMPNSLNDLLYSLNSDSVVWSTADNTTYFDVSYRLVAPYRNLLTFGIYAQYYEKSNAGKAPQLVVWVILSGLSVHLITRRVIRFY